MIISVSGKIGSGKDTVGLIIQYLTQIEGSDVYEDFQNFLGYYEEHEYNWKIKKFADKLKDIVCILLGCTREQLEDRDFKEKTLGKEWNKWLLCVDEGDDYYRGYFNTEKEAQEFFEDTYSVYPNFAHQDNYEGKITCWTHNIQEEAMSPRKILQLLGTDCGRDIIHPNIWVNSLMADYKPTSHKGPTRDLKLPNWIVTDTRFPNEAEAVIIKEGLLIRVNRGDGNTGDHPSETALDNYGLFNEIIDNNGSVGELVEKVRNILLKYKILK